MGFVALLSLLDHSPAGIPAGLSIGDPIPAWGSTVPLAVACNRSADGVTWSSTGFSVVAEAAAGFWARIVVTVTGSVTPTEAEHVNKILRGTGFPRLETNWRVKVGNKMCLNLPGTRHQVPVRAEALLDATGKVLGSVIVHGTGTSTVSVSPTTPAPKRAPLTPVAAPVRTAPVAEPVRAPVSPVKPEPVAAPLKAERMAPVTDPTGVFVWPTTPSGIWTKPGVENELDMLWKMHVAGDRQVIGFKGPAGTGKTSLAYDLAVRFGVPIAKVDGAGAITFADWVGATGATERNGATVTEFQPSGFLQAVRADGPMGGQPRIVLLDELNRAESSSATNALIPCLDHTGSLYIPDYRKAVALDPKVMYIVTTNFGAEYTGTIELDEALKDRVGHWEPMGYPPEAVEVNLVCDRTGLDRGIAVALVNAAATIRGIAAKNELPTGIGPRRVLMAARKIVAGFTPRRACISTWAEGYSAEGGATSNAATVQSRIEAAFRA